MQDNSELGQSLKQIIEHRLEKIKILKDAGINPFPHNFTLKDKISYLLTIQEPFNKILATRYNLCSTCIFLLPS